MPTIRQLLDRYGQPPADVALDWAWQIRQRVASHQASGDHCLLELDQWTQLEVTEDGQLVSDQLQAEVAQSALADLRQWAGRALPGDSTETAAAMEQPERTSQSVQTDALALSDQTTQTISHRARPHRSQPWLRKRKWIALTAAFLCASALLIALWPSSQATKGGLSLATNSEASDSQVAESESGPMVDQLDTLSVLEQTTHPNLDQGMATDGLNDLGTQSSLGQISLESSLGSTSPTTKTGDASIDVATAHAGSMSSPASQTPAAEPASSSDAMREVQQAVKQAEATESIAVANRTRGEFQDTRGEPWVLLRDTLRYRVTVSPKLNISRQSQWTLALEPITGLVVEPQRPVTIGAQGVALWRIYEAEAKSPRACLVVRALHHGRDGTLELVFCGGAEDMPGTTVPLAQRWLGPLTVRVQNQALELQGALAQLSTTVITRDQVPAVMQRKQAMIAQMLASARMGAVLPEINRLVELADGQVTMHGELRSKHDQPAIATWGRPGRQ